MLHFWLIFILFGESKIAIRFQIFVSFLTLFECFTCKTDRIDKTHTHTHTKHSQNASIVLFFFAATAAADDDDYCVVLCFLLLFQPPSLDLPGKISSLKKKERKKWRNSLHNWSKLCQCCFFSLSRSLRLLTASLACSLALTFTFVDLLVSRTPYSQCMNREKKIKTHTPHWNIIFFCCCFFSRNWFWLCFWPKKNFFFFSILSFRFCWKIHWKKTEFFTLSVYQALNDERVCSCVSRNCEKKIWNFFFFFSSFQQWRPTILHLNYAERKCCCCC